MRLKYSTTVKPSGPAMCGPYIWFGSASITSPTRSSRFPSSGPTAVIDPWVITSKR